MTGTHNLDHSAAAPDAALVHLEGATDHNLTTSRRRCEVVISGTQDDA